MVAAGDRIERKQVVGQYPGRLQVRGCRQQISRVTSCFPVSRYNDSLVIARMARKHTHRYTGDNFGGAI